MAFRSHSSMTRRAQPLLGTFVEVAVAGAPAVRSDAAISAAFAVVAQVHARMSFHAPDSDVSRLNNNAAGAAIEVDERTFAVLQAAADLHRRSGGLFNVAVAPVLQRLGLLPGSGAEHAGSCLLDHATDLIELGPGRHARLRQPNVRIDLGGIAKGFAVDCAVAVLREHGIPTGIVNAGGDLRAFGSDPHTIHIRDPRDRAAVLSRIVVYNEAVASTAGRPALCQSHDLADGAVIDPRCGAPPRAVCGASVRASSCMVADALTKVVMIAGEGASNVLEHYGTSAMFVSAAGHVCATSDWQDSIRLAS